MDETDFNPATRTPDEAVSTQVQGQVDAGSSVDAGPAEPTSSEPTSSEPTNSEPTNSEPTNSEPTNSEPTDPTSSDPADSDPTSSEPTSSDPAGSDPAVPPVTPHAGIRYAVLRLAMFVTVGGVLYILGMRSWALLFMAVLLSGIASFFVFMRQRNAAAANLEHTVHDWSDRRHAGQPVE